MRCMQRRAAQAGAAAAGGLWAGEERTVEITLNGYHTLILAALVMLVGHWLVFRIRLLSASTSGACGWRLLAAAIVYA